MAQALQTQNRRFQEGAEQWTTDLTPGNRGNYQSQSWEKASSVYHGTRQGKGTATSGKVQHLEVSICTYDAIHLGVGVAAPWLEGVEDPSQQRA